jgi:predicted permease
MTFWLRGLLLGFRPPAGFPMVWNLPIDVRVVTFAFGLALLAGLVFGLAPALRGSRTDLVAALKDGARTTAGARGKLGLRGALVVGQVAVCIVLLVGAALLVRGAQSAAQMNLGFEPGGLLTYDIDLSLLDYGREEGQQFFDAATARIEALPGVAAVGRGRRMPLSLQMNLEGIYVKGVQVSPDDPSIQVDTTRVSASYFETLGVPLLRGRLFGSGDTPESREVAVVSLAFAERYFPEGAVGETFSSGSLDGATTEIVGVVADTKVRTVGEQPRPYIYYAQEQSLNASGTLAVRLDRDTPELRAQVREQILALEPELISLADSDMMGLLALALFPVRFGAAMLIGAGVIALLLVSIGLYGVIAYSVAQRAKEIGVRMALGAASADVLSMVLRRGLGLVAIGAGIGGVVAALLSQALRSVLYGVGALDPLAFGAAFMILLVVAGLANWLPARRAARLDPVQALRAD